MGLYSFMHNDFYFYIQLYFIVYQLITRIQLFAIVQKY